MSRPFRRKPAVRPVGRVVHRRRIARGPSGSVLALGKGLIDETESAGAEKEARDQERRQKTADTRRPNALPPISYPKHDARVYDDAGRPAPRPGGPSRRPLRRDIAVPVFWPTVPVLIVALVVRIVRRTQGRWIARFRRVSNEV